MVYLIEHGYSTNSRYFIAKRNNRTFRRLGTPLPRILICPSQRRGIATSPTGRPRGPASARNSRACLAPRQDRLETHGTPLQCECSTSCLDDCFHRNLGTAFVGECAYQDLSSRGSPRRDRRSACRLLHVWSAKTLTSSTPPADKSCLTLHT